MALLRLPTQPEGEGEGKSQDDVQSFRLPRKLARLAGTPIILCMVGLPARGKSYLSKKLRRFLRWNGFTAEEFNAGNKRRELMKGGGQSADFFAGRNESGLSKRDEIALLTFDDLAQWIHGGGHVAIFDATNTTRARRKLLIRKCCEKGLPPPTFVETICTDSEVLEKNYRLKLRNADYKDKDPVLALADFKARVKEYEKVYEPLGSGGEGDLISYIKLENVHQARKVTTNRIGGFLASKIVSILQSLHISSRRIWITRHAESEDELHNRLGGDSAELTPRGRRFAEKLAEFVSRERRVEFSNADDEQKKGGAGSKDASSSNSVKLLRPLRVLSSTRRKCVLTGQPLKALQEMEEVAAAMARARARTASSKESGGQGSTRDGTGREGAMSVEEEARREFAGRYSAELKAYAGIGESTSAGGTGAAAAAAAAGAEPTPEAATASIDFFRTAALNEQDCGALDNLTDSEIDERYPMHRRLLSKRGILYRYPQGESFMDVVNRLSEVVIEIEREKGDVLVIAHTVTCRALLSYFLGTAFEKAFVREVPLGTVFEVQPRAYSSDLVTHNLSETND